MEPNSPNLALMLRLDGTNATPPSGGPTLGSKYNSSPFDASSLHPSEVSSSNSAWPAFDPLLLEEAALFQQLKTLLEAKQIHGSNRFEFQLGRYSTCLDSLEQQDNKLWEHVSYRLKCDVIKDSMIVIKMPATVFHARFCRDVDILIHDKIKDLKSASSGATEDLLGDIWACGDASVSINSGTSLCPDGQYYLGQKSTPSVVFEVASSESLGHISAKAIEYLTFTKGKVRLVINFDCTYRRGIKRLDLHVWSWPIAYVKYEICKGDHVNPGTLAIPLKVFGTPEALAAEYPGANLDEKIILNFDELVACYRVAMDAHTTTNEIRKNEGLAEDLP